MENRHKTNIPTILVIFGATGDLVAKKIAPAVYHLYKKNKLPQLFKAVGFSRREWNDSEFKEHVKNILGKHDLDSKVADSMLQNFSYVKGEFGTEKNYKDLSKRLKLIDDKWGVCSNKLFYLAVPPENYETIFRNLHKSKLTDPCSDEEGWTRVIVEKPFGKDLKTAQVLEKLLSSLFREEQIYRIDHYLAKEMLQNVLSFRFSNTLFESNWGNHSIESIDIKLWEDIGAEDRGAFYDGVGALRDVGQNHLLQMLALTCMENPGKFEAKAIRNSRTELLKTLNTPNEGSKEFFSYRAQYKSYKKIKGVNPNSDTETYFMVSARLNHPRWEGIKIMLESGKRMGERKKEIAVTFKHPDICLCPPEAKEHFKNTVVFSLEPEERIDIHFWSKKPGLDTENEKRTLNFRLRKSEERTQYVEEYEKLLLDCILGDQTLFVSSQEVEAMWRFIDPYLKSWKKNNVPLENYEPDTAPVAKDANKAWGATPKPDKPSIGIVGLGKMGRSLMEHLLEKNWRVSGFDKKDGEDLADFLNKLSGQKLIWLMVPHAATDEVINELLPNLKKGDTLIDGGNTFYKDSVKRYEKLKKEGINFLDVGVSGGPEGARRGASLMIGGDREIYEKFEKLWKDLAVPSGYAYMGKSGAGHFVKMVHNGIEYGMMQALAEGYNVMKESNYEFDLQKIAEVYNHGSVVESRLVGWLKDAYEEFGKDLKNISGSVAHTGEGEWTVKTAEEFGVPAEIIKKSLEFRIQSEKNPSYTGKILSALRNQFGGHSEK